MLISKSILITTEYQQQREQRRSSFSKQRFQRILQGIRYKIIIETTGNAYGNQIGREIEQNT